MAPWLRWTSFLFGLATLVFLIQGINRAYVASQLEFNAEYVAKTTQSLLAALVCLSAAVLPVVWSVVANRHQGGEVASNDGSPRAGSAGRS